jgi:hypothetical protein
MNNAEKPIKEFRAGTVVAAIWVSKNAVNGQSSAQHSIRVQKRYRDDRSGQWKTTTYFRPDELPKLSLVVSRAYEFLTLREAADMGPAQKQD